MIGFHELKEQQRNQRHGFPDNLAIRVHRALSWLKKAEACEGDNDAQFIFLWIAFNAAYANEVDKAHRLPEAQTFEHFIEKLYDLDKDKHLAGFIWEEFAGSIRVLLDNKFIYQPFWDFKNGYISEIEWTTRFDNAKKYANKALGNANTPQVLTIIFERVYTLRNQLLHGGATHDSAVNREQIRDCCRLMKKLVPTIIKIMMENPNTLWGDAHYPVLPAQ
ncbi:hypothetical protein [Psychromonas aquatilis]|uniref:Apea-like HEPN domain-containing protein n=1 Tax=Psychromonas aquatilis TaxID=2005072 RepID=A0ABU9GTQ4_9GAMM